MSPTGSTMFAQILAEVRVRLRSPATLVTVLILLAATFFWIPNPDLNATSLSWKRASDGARISGLYNASYIGTVSAMLASSFLTLIGFYLVAGSVNRDRRCGVGVILAATPLSNQAYLFGKFLAHWIYLLVLAGIALLTGMLVFVRYGTGPFSLTSFLWPSFLLAVPGLAFTAALAVFSDVTPGLRGRGGLIAWLFLWAFLLFLLPIGLHTGFNLSRRVTSLPIYDPPGSETLRSLIYETVPDAMPGSISMGRQNHERIERIEWGGFPVSATLVGARAGAILWAALPLILAVLIFDRFDPSRSRPRAHGPDPAGWLARMHGRRKELILPETPLSPGSWKERREPLDLHPTLWGGIVAESRLIWDLASWIKWPLLASALLSIASLPATALFLLLLAPVLSEVAAREDLHGTRAMVFSQPGVPSSPVLWKAASVTVFVLVLGMPRIVRAFLVSPAHGIAFLTGLLFLAGFCVGAGSLTRGGKLFSGVYTALWYVSYNGGAVGIFDFAGAFGSGLETEIRLTYLLIGAVLLGLAILVERRRRVSG